MREKKKPFKMQMSVFMSFQLSLNHIFIHLRVRDAALCHQTDETSGIKLLQSSLFSTISPPIYKNIVKAIYQIDVRLGNKDWTDAIRRTHGNGSPGLLRKPCGFRNSQFEVNYSGSAVDRYHRLALAWRDSNTYAAAHVDRQVYTQSHTKSCM